MKLVEAPRLLRNRFLIAVLAGLLLALAFPKTGIAGFAWIAPALLAAAALGRIGWESFRIGYIGGLAYYLVSLNWLLRIPYRWHGIPFGPALGLLALSAFLALYPALWVWLVCEVRPSIAASPKAEEGGSPAIPGWAGGPSINAEAWVQRLGWALSGAMAWVALEMCIARFLSGFPWDLLGVSQYRLVPLIQIASVTGVYGVSFLIVWGSLSLLLAIVGLLKRPAVRYVWLAEIILPLTSVLAVFVFGMARIRHAPEVGKTLNVTFVQPSIPQEVIWNEKDDEVRFRELIQLTREALTNKTDLLLWPEASVPGLLRYNEETFNAITGLARSNHVWMIVGADDAEPKKKPLRANDADYFNSSFLISPDGLLMSRYRKRNLVIFGEYIPLVDVFPFIKYLTPIQGVFTRGDHAVPFTLRDLGIKTSVLICFEDVFPHLAREYASDDIDFLVNLTNNGWFGEGSAQWQHGTSALFRAVENGLPLLRCSNNGLTCWVDECGRIRQIFGDSKGTIYGPGVMTAQIPVPASPHPRTFYNEHGDWFGWTCVALTLIKIGRRALRARRK